MISAIVHTYNEEQNIRKCLNSLEWVDEIIVVDMGSQDNTRKIAREFTDNIFDHPYTGFVEPARNFGITKAKGEWIIIVDADEEIPLTLARHLKELAVRDEADYYRIARKNLIFNHWMRHAGWWPDYQIRFFRKGSVTWTEKIHGVPETVGRGFDNEASENLSITHYHYTSLKQYISRLNRYTSITAKERFAEGKNFTLNSLLEAPAKEFINRYLFWRGYKDGLHGLALSFLQAFSELVVELKIWELEKFHRKQISLAEVHRNFLKHSDNIEHWFTEQEISGSPSPLRRLVLKLKRKIRLAF